MRCCRQTNGLIVYPLLMFMLVAVALFSGCSPSSETAVQCYYVAQSTQHALPTCELYLLNVKPNDGRRNPRGVSTFRNLDDSSNSRLDVYIQTMYARLHFEKDNDVFKGSYTISFVVRDLNESIVWSKDVERTAVARSYAETVSFRFDAFIQSILLPPAQYLLDVVIVDNGSGLRQRYRRNLQVKNFSGEKFSASDYLLFENAQTDQRGISLTPTFPRELSYARDSIGIFQEVYNVNRGDTIRLHIDYASPRREGLPSLASLSTPYLVRPPECTRAADSTYFSSDSAFIAGTSGTLQTFQYVLKPATGASSITRRVFRSRNGMKDSSSSIMSVSIYSQAFPRYSGVDEEIAALSAIARGEEIDSMQSGKSVTDQRIRISQFWEKHGGTIRQKEFDDRVREANVLFSSCVEGWKTPMGITYIICGPPDYVECQGYGSEIWYYDLGGNRALSVPFRLNLENEFGKYYEIVPFSINDFLWQQFVDRWRRQ